jgi:adenosylcobinamide kinase / adenosylcobinamide-phosphate guanylyltransferase
MPPTPPLRTLILGGCRSGKSAEAELRAGTHRQVLYVATGGHDPTDPEWAARIATHQARRPPHWRTVHTRDLAGVLTDTGHHADVILVDSLTAWLADALDRAGAWDDAADPVRVAALLRSDIDVVTTAWRNATVPIVMVSDEVGSGIVPDTVSGRRFRDELGRLNIAMGKSADVAVLVVAGHVVPLTPAL